MKQFLLKNKRAITGVAAALCIGVIALSFQDSPFVTHDFSSYDSVKKSCDTVPDRDYNNSMKMKDFDRIISELDQTMLKTSDELKKIDMDKIMKDVEVSLASIDAEKIMKDVQLSLKQVDLDKIMQDVKESLQSVKDIKIEDVNGEVEKALKEAKVEMENAKKEMDKVDTKSIRRELEKAREEVAKSKLEIGKIDMGKIMDEAKEGIDKAKTELRQIKAMFLEMEKDGLVDTKKGFSIEYKNKDLYIDGKKQSEQVTDKYRHYFKDDHFKMTIEKE